ncbi:PQQ-binding-like beta-propeller repeat protein [Planctomycetota bacterium]
MRQRYLLIILSITFYLVSAGLLHAQEAEITLTDGTLYQCVILSETETTIKIKYKKQTTAGEVELVRTLKKTDIKEVNIKKEPIGETPAQKSNLEIYEERLAQLDENDINDVLTLARWAGRHGLGRQSLELQEMAYTLFTAELDIFNVEDATKISHWFILNKIDMSLDKGIIGSLTKAIPAQDRWGKAEALKLNELLNIYNLEYVTRATLLQQAISRFMTDNKELPSLGRDMDQLLVLFDKYSSEPAPKNFYMPILKDKIAACDPASDEQITALSKWAADREIFPQVKTLILKSYHQKLDKYLRDVKLFKLMKPPSKDSDSSAFDAYRFKKDSIATDYQHLVKFARNNYLEKEIAALKKKQLASLGSQDSPMFRGNAAHTGFYPSGLGKAEDGKPNLRRIFVGDKSGNLHALFAESGKLCWRQEIGEAIDTSPVVVDGTVYAGSNNGKLYAFNAKTGVTKWEFPTGGPIASTPAVTGDTVYLCSTDKYLYAINAKNGNRKWEKKIGDKIFASPTVVDGRIFVGMFNNQKMYAYDNKIGQKIWEKEIGRVLYSSPTAGDGYIFFGTASHAEDDPEKLKRFFYALDTDTGEILWKVDVKCDISSTAAFVNGVVYVGARDGQIYALDAEKGKEYWRAELGGAIFSTPALVDGKMFVGCLDGYVYALDAIAGHRLWRFQTGDAVYSSPAVVSDVVYIASYDTNLYALDAAKGTVKWKYELGATTSSSPAVAD